jgi:hypothetical protein
VHVSSSHNAKTKKVLFALSVLCVLAVLTLVIAPWPSWANTTGATGDPWLGSVLAPATPTQLPDRGVRITTPRVVTIAGGDVTVEALFDGALDGDTLVSVASVSGGYTLVAIDLQYRSGQRLLPISQRQFGQVRISGSYLIWHEADRQVHVFDRRRMVESALPARPTNSRQLDARDGLIVWSEPRDGHSQLLLYDLSSPQTITVVAENGIHYAFPRVCSRDWILYSTWQPVDGSAAAPRVFDLYARNLSTNTDIRVGEIPYPLTAFDGRQQDCEGRWATWRSGLQRAPL